MPDPTGDLNKLLTQTAGGIAELNKQMDAFKARNADLGSSSGPAASMAKFNKELAATGETHKHIIPTITGLTDRFKDLAKVLAGPAGIAYGFYQVGRALGEFAESRVRLQNLSTDIGFTTEKIDLMERTMRRMGRTTEEAKQIYSAFGLATKEMAALREGSPLFQIFRDAGEAAFGEKLIAGAKDVGKTWDEVLKHIKAGSDEYQDYMAAKLGIPRSVIDSYGEFEKTTQKGFEASYQHSQKYLDGLLKIETTLGNIVARAEEFAVAQIANRPENIEMQKRWATDPNFLRSRHAGPEAMWPGYLGTATKSEQIGDEIRRKGAESSYGHRYGDIAGGADYGPTGESGAKYLAEDSNKSLRDIRDTLMRMEEKAGGGVGEGEGGQPAGPLGAASRGQYGVGARRTGGALQAPLGGFRPNTALSTRIGEAKAAMTDELIKQGVPKEHAAEAANLLAGQAIAESNLNPQTVHDQGTGYGIYGARLERRDKMLAWMKEKGYAPESLEGQSRYMAVEAMSGKYPRTKEALTGATEAGRAAASDVITGEFEAPAGGARAHPRAGFVGTAAGVVPGAETHDDKFKGVAGGKVSGDMGILSGVDPRLVAAAKGGAAYLPEGYSIRPTSGVRHGRSQSFHYSGQASDWEIVTPDGKALSNRGDDPTGLYRRWAQGSKTWAAANDPSLVPRMGWGGAFETSRGSGTRDIMHLDLGGPRGNLDPSSRMSNLPLIREPPTRSDAARADWGDREPRGREVSDSDRNRFDKTQSTAAPVAAKVDAGLEVDFKNIPSWVKTGVEGGKFNRLKVTRSTAGGARSEEPVGSTDSNRWSY